MVPVVVIMAIVILILYLRKKASGAQSDSSLSTRQTTDTVPSRLDEISSPPAYEDIELHGRLSAVSNRDYDVVADNPSNNQQLYVNFEPLKKESSNQYETLQLPSNSCDADEGHVYAEANPKTYWRHTKQN